MNSRTKQRWDILIIGALAGFLGVLVKDLLELGVLFLIPTYKSCPRLAAGIILDPKIATGNILPIVGLEIDIAISIVVGIIVASVLSQVGWRFLFAKGLILGLLAWTIIDIILSKLLSQVPPPNSIVQIELSLLIHFVYGVTVVWTAFILSKKHLISK